MPRFFFDLYDNGARHIDLHGEELADLPEARDQAICLLPDMMRDSVPDGESHECRCDVRCEAGRVVYRATLTLSAGPVDESLATVRRGLDVN